MSGQGDEAMDWDWHWCKAIAWPEMSGMVGALIRACVNCRRRSLLCSDRRWLKQHSTKTYSYETRHRQSKSTYDG